MTFFITERDSTKTPGKQFVIIGVDEFRNEEYLRELNIGRQSTVNYDIQESVNPCRGYNDGSYYVQSDGHIGWRSCELLAQPLLPALPAIHNIGYEGDAYTNSDGLAIAAVRIGVNTKIRVTAPDGYVILPDMARQVEFIKNFGQIEEHTFILRKI